MGEQVLTQVILGLAVLGLLIYRQLVARRVGSAASRFMLVLVVIGVIETVQFLQRHHGGSVTIAALAGSLVLAAIFGALRARTVRVWLSGETAWTQGNWVTALLWIVALAAHLGYDALLNAHRGTSGLGDATIVLYLAFSLGVQRVIVQQRARRLSPQGTATPFFGAGPAGGSGG